MLHRSLTLVSGLFASLVLATGLLHPAVAAGAPSAVGRDSAAGPTDRMQAGRTAPRAPRRLVAASRTSTAVRLTWQPPRDRTGVTGYRIYRNGVILGGALNLRYVARNLRPNTEYRFTVRARDRAGKVSKATALTVRTTRARQATGDVRAYVLTSDGESFADARLHYLQLDRVFPTFFDMTRAGDVVGTGQPHLTSWFQDRGVLVLPRFHTEDPAVIEALVTDPVRRTRGAEQIAQVVATGGYDGANLDFEMNMPSGGIDGLSKEQRWDRLRDGYSAFVDEVSALVHDGGGLVSVAVSPNWCSVVEPSTRQSSYCTDSSHPSTRRGRAYLFDYPRLAAAADEVWVMAWGLHWATSESGPVADLQWLRAVTDYTADVLADAPQIRAELTLGTNLYGMDWSEKVVRTDRVPWPEAPFPTAPSCAIGPVRTARARTTYEGEPGAGTLVVEWVCLTRYAATWEFGHIDPKAFTSKAFDEAAAEGVLTAADPTVEGAQRILWYVDVRTIDRRAALTSEVGWQLGFWRLGREDQRIWSLDALAAGARS